MAQMVCSPICAQKIAVAKREKAEKKDIRQRREKLKTRSDWMKEAQVAFNAWVRERDKDDPCISCQRYHQGSYDAGHYRSRGAAPALRFNEDNCHKQCVPCNQHKSGNIIEYRINLIKKIGSARINFIESEHAPEKWTVEEIKAIRDLYRAKLKELKK